MRAQILSKHKSDYPKPSASRPVITYLSRQMTGRRLTDQGHLDVIEELQAIAKTGKAEYRMEVFEDVPVPEQWARLARTTVCRRSPLVRRYREADISTDLCFGSWKRSDSYNLYARIPWLSRLRDAARTLSDCTLLQKCTTAQPLTGSERLCSFRSVPKYTALDRAE